MQAFREHAPPAARLNYFSCEQYPLARADLIQALSPHQPGLSQEIEGLTEIYPPHLPGIHALPFPPDPRIQLILLYGDATAMFASLGAPSGDSASRERNGQTVGIDAWYLDGFAPARNPEMWRGELFLELARLSAAGATFATYTSAGAVRRAMSAAGFAVEKIPGFAQKREMLRGQFPANNDSDSKTISTPRTAVVIGGGLAGTATARSLVRRGYRVTLIEREDRIAPGASGNAMGVAVPAPTALPTPLSRLTRVGFHYLLATVAGLQRKFGPNIVPTIGQGVLLLAHTPEIEERFEAFARNFSGSTAGKDPETETDAKDPTTNESTLKPKGPSEPDEFARPVPIGAAAAVCGTNVTCPGLYFPAARCFSPPGLCEAFLREAYDEGANESALRIVFETEAIHLEQSATGWRILNQEQHILAEATVVVLGNGHDATKFSQTAWMPLKMLRGQTFALPERPDFPKLTAAICYDGYITPAAMTTDTGSTAQFQIGATFEKWNQNPEILPEQNRRLYERLGAMVPEFSAAREPTPESLPARVAFRTVSRDHFPVIGPVPDPDRWAEADAAAGAAGLPDFTSNLPGLYVIAALGSRGLIFAGIGAEIVAGQIAGETIPIETDLVRSLAPDRYLRRTAKRNARAHPDYRFSRIKTKQPSTPKDSG